MELDDLMEIIAGAIYTHYNLVDNETIPWDPEDEEYKGRTYTVEELLNDGVIPPPSSRDSVREYIAELFDDRLYCQRDYCLPRVRDRYKFAWAQFCQLVKYERRYFFPHQQKTPITIVPGEEPLPEDTISTGEMLDRLGEVTLKHGYVRTLPQGTNLYRVRVHNSSITPTEAHEFGPPPNDQSAANRMSPTGISMFYAATGPRTALAETSPRADKDYSSLTQWRAIRPLRIVDFTRHPNVPSFYEAERSRERDQLLFLADFVKDITKPVDLGGSEHIEYVPTQIVTEYFRHVFRTLDGKRVDGIMYPSARHPGGKCVTLFAGYEAFNPKFPDWLLDDAPVSFIRKILTKKPASSERQH
jgi:hypothetical protein